MRWLSGKLCQLFATSLHSQFLTLTPVFSNDYDNIIITADTGKGNQDLNNYSDPNGVYVQIGIITSASTPQGDWQHTLFAWEQWLVFIF